MSQSVQIGNQQQQQMLPNAQPGQLWILIETSKNKVTNYSIIDANEVIGFSNENMHTGKSVYVRNGNITMQAIIVIISDDREFLYAELAQLKRQLYSSNQSRRSDNNLNSLNDAAFTEVCVGLKKRRLSSDIKYPIPPMTFDQGTQTDTKITEQSSGVGSATSNDAAIGKISETQNALLQEIRLLRHENKDQRQSTQNMTKKFIEMEKIVRTLNRQITSVEKSLERKLQPSDSSKCVEYKIIADANEYTIEPVEVDENNLEDSEEPTENRKLNGSTSVIQNTCFSSASVTPTRNQDASNFHISPQEIVDMIRSDWVENDPGNENVVIGANGTTVPARILESVNWSSPSGATRKLLTTIFNRDILASHTLTGKPSPAFHGREKPHKNQLEPKKIADIVHVVAKYCKVTESVVRCAITTKCADENKMSRIRQQKRSSLVDKENVNTTVVKQEGDSTTLRNYNA